LEDKINLDGLPLPDWALFPAGVAWAINEAGFELPGLEVVYTSNIPPRAGLGLPTALEVGVAMIWQFIGGWSIERMFLAQL
jgi:galactokinase